MSDIVDHPSDATPSRRERWESHERRAVTSLVRSGAAWDWSPADADDIAERIGCSRGQAQTILVRMERRGLVETRYRLTARGERAASEWGAL